MKDKTILYIGLLTGLLAACQDAEDITSAEGGGTVGNIINVGGISTDELLASVTRADGDDTPSEEEVQLIDAEQVSWLRGPLFSGLDITYGKGDRSNKHVAILKLLPGSGTYGIQYSEGRLAEYSFKYRDDATGAATANDAIWYDNGAHFFEGVYVPDEIQYTTSGTTETAESEVWGSGGSAPGLKSDQHDDNATKTETTHLGNYTLLAHYLGMPSNFTLNATVARVKLPFRHRLSRVLAYILIDPEMGNDVTIKGYKQDASGNAVTDENATTTSIRFCNVKVLEGVQDSYNETTKHHTYTPQWGEVRKAIPHFVGERGSYDDANNTSLIDEHFIAYYDTDEKVYYYPTDAMWTTLNSLSYDTDGKCTSAGFEGKYERTIYGKVPVYDLIVRPTYSQLGRVMYDEYGFYDSNGNINEPKRQDLYNQTNKIDFEITLSNGLHYTKEFVFDLDANYQTVVYLHISRERVDYNSSGSVLWQETVGYDDWYGVNNQNGNTLSMAGSGWQRAYTNGSVGEAPSTFTDDVTDGHYYTHDSEDEEAQYVTDDKWIEMLFQAYKGGPHHGDYFILKKDISIPASRIPGYFRFTGHLDSQDHTITITGDDEDTFLFDGLNGNYTTAQESDPTKTWEANVHKEGSHWVPYMTATDGWRAEIINTRFVMEHGKGAVFNTGASITGYLHNCWLNRTYDEEAQKWNGKLNDHIPSIPEY